MGARQAGPDQPERPLRRDAAQNRERLLRAAFDLFAEQGPEVGVNEIARRAGVGPGTLYRRFPTKEALVDELYEVVLDEMLAAIRQSLAGDVPGEALEQCLRRLGEIMAAHRGCLARLFAARPAGAADRAPEWWAAVEAMLVQAKSAGRVRPQIAIPDVRLCLISLRCVVEETVADTPDLWRRHLDLLLAGLRPAGVEAAAGAR
jgi:AcrR family transcriptional regulator